MTFHSQLSTRIELPDLLITRQNNLVKLVYDSSTHLYRNSANANFINNYENYRGYHVKTLTLNNLLFVAIYNSQTSNTNGIIIKFTNTLQQITKREFNSGFSSFATDDTRIFISSEGKLVSLNQDLEFLDEVDLEIPAYGRKNAHEILTYQNTAYLLDNIVMPVYILRVDIGDPRSFRIKSTIPIEDTNFHLVGQWLEPSLNQWCVIESYGGRGGAGKIIHIYSLKEGDVKLGIQGICHDDSGLVDTIGHEGIDIIAITQLPPIWAIIKDEGQRTWLAKVNTEDNVITFEKRLNLRIATNDKAQSMTEPEIKYKNNYLFFTYSKSWRNVRILVIDVKFEEKPQLILNQEISPSFPFQSVELSLFQGVELLQTLTQLETRLPYPDAVVLGRQSPGQLNAAVLGGLEEVKRDLASPFNRTKIAALSKALKLGEEGMNLVEEVMKTETGAVQWTAFELLWESGNESNKKELIQYFPLNSAMDLDYTSLRNLLASKQWKEANQETYLILKQKQKKSYNSGEPLFINFFPCEDFYTIDRLWIKFSNGHFGFSVQKQIFDSLVKKVPKEYSIEDWNKDWKTLQKDWKIFEKKWEAFADKINWCFKKNWLTKRKWLTLSELSYSIESPQGHLPVMLDQEKDVQVNFNYRLYFITWWRIWQKLTICRIH